ncbi:uncharacterized protein BDV17DRAFT_261083 [Aspergillus undulatus]|uniref:uncharacterized protein n=1 Tax=Aspergillus undulatus TaxID=1810928 RepID=UPI003CCE014A
MRLEASWLLAALGLIASATGNNIIEVDLVFPQNKAYTPTEWFPAVFAFQNPVRAQYLNFGITYHFRRLTDNNYELTRSHDLRFANWTRTLRRNTIPSSMSRGNGA